jgi:hypothetical protein
VITLEELVSMMQTVLVGLAQVTNNCAPFGESANPEGIAGSVSLWEIERAAVLKTNTSLLAEQAM